jgi:hypothetical protein
MVCLKRRLGLVLTTAVLVTCTFSSACTAWHTTALEPQRFRADSSPERARLTLGDGTRLTATHPVLVGDSLVWAAGSRVSPGDATRSTLPARDIQKVEVRRVDAPRTIGLLVGMAAAGFYALLYFGLRGLGGA